MSRATSAGPAVRVESLDLLRLLAALAVVLFHYTYRGAAADGLTTVSVPEWAPATRFGGVGVDLFFVISGFVIAWSAAGRTATGFAIARVSRIYPGFVACMSLTFLVTLAFGAPRFETGLPQWLANLAIAAPFLGQPFMDGAYWSIVYELIFYGWVVMILQADLFGRHLHGVVAFWLAISLLDITFLHSPILERAFITHHSGSFAAGILLFMLRTRGARPVTLGLLAIATGVAARQGEIAMAWNRVHFGGAWPDEAGVALAIGTVLLVALASRIDRLPLPASLVVALGGLTYPLYLLHQNIGYIVFNRLDGRIADAALVAGAVAAMIGLSFLVWRFVERPLQRRLRLGLSAIADAVGARLAGRAVAGGAATLPTEAPTPTLAGPPGDRGAPVSSSG